MNLLDFSTGPVEDSGVASRKKSGRGGAREGAGRRKIVKDPVRLTVDHERADFELLEAIADERGTSIASVVREAVRAYVRRRRAR